MILCGLGHATGWTPNLPDQPKLELLASAAPGLSQASGRGTGVAPSRLRPDPVAFFNRFADDSTIVLFVPADGVEGEPAIRTAVVFEGLAADDVVWELRRELGHQRVQGFGVLAVR